MKIHMLSLWQPHASLLGRGKKHETRHWGTEIRGIFAIHAAKNTSFEVRELCYDKHIKAALPPDPYLLCNLLTPNMRPQMPGLPLGAVVAITCLQEIRLVKTEDVDVDVSVFPALVTPYGETMLVRSNGTKVAIDLKDRHFGNYSPGRYAWLMEPTMILKEPIPMRGSQGIGSLEITRDLLDQYKQFVLHTTEECEIGSRDQALEHIDRLNYQEGIPTQVYLDTLTLSL